MAQVESRRTWEMLNDLSDRGSLSIPTWLALVEDRLRGILQPESQLLARFLKLKKEVDPDGAGGAAAPGDRLREIQSECTGIILAARGLVAAAAEDPSLDGEVERIIQKGYFKSWPFRFVIVGFGLVLTLVTGVEGFNLYQQVQAAHRLVDQAKEYVDKSKDQIAEAKSVIANREAEMALLVLQGDQELVKMRIKALQDVDGTRLSTMAEVQGRGKKAIDDVVGAGASGVKDVGERVTGSLGEVDNRKKKGLDDLDTQVNKDRGTLAAAVQAVVRNLENSKSPWVPVVIWSMTKWWLLFLLPIVLSILAWVNSLARIWEKDSIGFAVLGVNALVLVGIVALVYWRV